MRRCLTLCLAGALSTAMLLAQETTGDIRGTVHDPNGAVVTNATVIIKNTDQNSVIRNLHTDSGGAYVATTLPIGRYEVTVSAPGFQSYNGTNLMLNVADHRVVDVTLTLGSAEQTVDVTDSSVQ